MSRCKACNTMIERDIKDPISGEISDLCGVCFRQSEYVRANTFMEPSDYAHMGAYEGLRRPNYLPDEG